MASVPEKKTRCLKVWVGDQLGEDLAKLARFDARTLSEYAHKILALHVYGQLEAFRHMEEESDGT